MVARGEGRTGNSARSPPIAMRVLAAILTLACSCQLHAQPSPKLVHSILGGSHRLQRVLTCATQLGPIRCLNAFTVWRAERALDNTPKPTAQFNLISDIEQFPWTQYNNVSDEQLYSQLCEGTKRLLRRRSLTLSVPGYRFELESKGNGTLNVDMLRNTEVESGRSSKKKLKKMFSQIIPLLVLPGLLMAAVLPFILPALKMMTIGAGLLNNMALTGAVFTLLRNNAFNDKYEHKILYVNAGYKNEKHAPSHYEEGHPTNENYDEVYAEANTDEHNDIKNGHTFSDTIETIEEGPLKWGDVYGDSKYYKIIGHRIEKKTGNYNV